MPRHLPTSTTVSALSAKRLALTHRLLAEYLPLYINPKMANDVTIEHVREYLTGNVSSIAGPYIRALEAKTSNCWNLGDITQLRRLGGVLRRRDGALIVHVLRTYFVALRASGTERTAMLHLYYSLHQETVRAQNRDELKSMHKDSTDLNVAATYLADAYVAMAEWLRICNNKYHSRRHLS